MFSADSAFKLDDVTVAETKMGVDGKMTAAVVPQIYTLTVNLEAASPSVQSLTHLWSAMMKTKKAYECTLVSSIPSLNRLYVFTRCVLTKGAPLPEVKKTLEATSWTFNFEAMTIVGL